MIRLAVRALRSLERYSPRGGHAEIVGTGHAYGGVVRSTNLLTIGPLTVLSCFVALIACGSSNDDSPDTSQELDASSQDASSQDASSQDVDVDVASPDASDAASPVATVSVADVCSNTAKTICAYLETCTPEATANLWASATECEPRFRENCLASYPTDTEVRKDDAEEYASCLAKLTCDDLYGPRWSTACDLPRLAASKPIAAPCRSDFECESRTCTGSSTACGTCVTRKNAGESCSSSRECRHGGYCDKNCYAPAYLDEPCDTFRICGNGLVCTGGTCKKTGSNVGDTCSTDRDCDLPALIACNKTSGKCEKTTFADPNGACPKAFDDGPPIDCGKGSSCITPNADEPGTCVVNAKVGEACGDTVRCEAFVNCRDGKCVLPTWSACQ